VAGYKIKSGDTLSQIAKKNGMSLKALLGANPGIKNANKIRVGQSIKVPSTKMMPGSKTDNPYKDIKPGQMADMDVKNKSEKRQRRATGSMQNQVTKGGSKMNDTPSRTAVVKEKKSGRNAMLDRARAKRKQIRGYSSGGKVGDNNYKSCGANVFTGR
jgi:LysM repeat protein